MSKALCLAFAMALAAPAAAAQPADNRIVPGQRIGPWTIDMTVADLNRVIGPKTAIGNPPDQTEFLPSQQDLVRPLWIHRWDQVRLRALTVEKDDQQIVGLTIFVPEFKTAEGIAVGSSREAVIAAYGPPTAETAPNPNQRHLIYDKFGVTFRVGQPPQQEAKVVLVNVFRAGTASERWKYSP